LRAVFGSGNILKAKKSKKGQLKKARTPEFEDVNFGIQIMSTNGVLDRCKNDSALTSVGPEQSKNRLHYYCSSTLAVTSIPVQIGTSQPGGYKEMSSILTDQ
jgi:hypothetical protein